MLFVLDQLKKFPGCLSIIGYLIPRVHHVGDQNRFAKILWYQRINGLCQLPMIALLMLLIPTSRRHGEELPRLEAAYLHGLFDAGRQAWLDPKRTI
jgi:hypothetical protein